MQYALNHAPTPVEQILAKYSDAVGVLKSCRAIAPDSDVPVPDTRGYPGWIVMGDVQSLAFAVAELLAQGYTPNNPMTIEKKIKIVSGAVRFAPLGNESTVQVFNMKLGAEFGVFAFEGLNAPNGRGLYLSDNASTFEAVSEIWAMLGPGLQYTFREAPSADEEDVSGWAIPINAMPGHVSASTIWMMGKQLGFNAYEAQPGIFYLTAIDAPGKPKGNKAVIRAIDEAVALGESSFRFGIHAHEAMRLLSRLSTGFSVSMEVGKNPGWGTVTLTKKENRPEYELLPGITAAIIEARKNGSGCVDATTLGAPAIRRAKYRAGGDLRVVVTKKELWFISKEQIAKMIAGIEQAVMFGDLPIDVNYSDYFSGAAPSFPMSVFRDIPALAGLSLNVRDGVLSIAHGGTEQPTGESFRGAIIHAAKTAIERDATIEVDCPYDRLSAARTYIYMALGKGKVKTRYEAGKLIIYPA